MAIATPATIKTQILAGTYPDNTITVDNVFDFEQFEGRRKYPSCEIVATQPESTTETSKETSVNVAFEIRYFSKNLGIRTDEVANQKLVEDIILAQIESFTLEDHKIVLESKIWSRQQVDKSPKHPSYQLSVLKITVRRVKISTINSVGTLTFVSAGSLMDSNPGTDYTYSNVFDVDILSSYNDIEESYTSSRIKMSYTGDLRGRFICSIMVNNSDFGTTGEKLNNLPKIRSNGEKENLNFKYVDKTASGSVMTHTFFGEPDSVQMLYRTNEATVFRLTVRLLSDVTITIT